MITGLVEHRLLVNYEADPEVVRRVLPSPFRPQLVDGRAVVGICLIRLRGLRPAGLPRQIGLGTDNAAHRFAVEWDTDDGRETGVYIARRDTQSLTTVLAGGRLFPGVHHPARFHVATSDDEVHIAMQSLDRRVAVDVAVESADELASGLFPSTEAASAFFERGAIGWSPGRQGRLQGLELCTNAWRVEPVTVRSVTSSYFDDTRLFPTGSLRLDCGLLMRDVPVSWRRVADLRRDDVGHVRPRGVHRRVPAGAR